MYLETSRGVVRAKIINIAALSLLYIENHSIWPIIRNTSPKTHKRKTLLLDHFLSLKDIPLHSASESSLQNPALFLFFSLAKGTYNQRVGIHQQYKDIRATNTKFIPDVKPISCSYELSFLAASPYTDPLPPKLVHGSTSIKE